MFVGAAGNISSTIIPGLFTSPSKDQSPPYYLSCYGAIVVTGCYCSYLYDVQYAGTLSHPPHYPRLFLRVIPHAPCSLLPYPPNCRRPCITARTPCGGGWSNSHFIERVYTMTLSLYCRSAISPLCLVISFLLLSTSSLVAQQYSYLPTASTTDGRFISVTGGSIQTLADNSLVFKLASPATSPSIEIGIFDGDTQGIYDIGTVPLIFRLFADPEGNGTGTTQIAEWQGTVMTNNTWYTATISNAATARCTSGDYFYTLKVLSSDPTIVHWSNFKLRTTGTIAIANSSNFTFSTPLGSALDAAVIYPSYPALQPTTYNGEWHFNMSVPNSLSSLALWDGDFDRGSYNCIDNDINDEDTPNERPSWATGAAVAEGTAASTLPCQNSAGQPIGGTTTSNPPDDARNAAFARPNGVSYELIAPGNVHYANTNPSGNLEWEQFRLSTEAFNRSVMDYHADALPAGIYTVAISGMDLANLNAMRFPYDVAGVDASGNTVTPIHPDYTNGVISGTVYYEASNNCSQGLLELGIPLAVVQLSVDYNGDGVTDAVVSTVTDLLGHFNFTGLHPGAYSVTVDKATLALGIDVICDSDGEATPNQIRTNLTMCSRSMSFLFGYRLNHLLGQL